MSSDLPVLREILHDENSILLPSDDLDAWQEAINEIIKNNKNAESLSRNAYETAKNYTWEKRVHKIFSLLKVG